jgi:hypothetical protein
LIAANYWLQIFRNLFLNLLNINAAFNQWIAYIAISHSHKSAIVKGLIADKILVHSITLNIFLTSRFIFAEKANNPGLVDHSL